MITSSWHHIIGIESIRSHHHVIISLYHHIITFIPSWRFGRATLDEPCVLEFKKKQAKDFLTAAVLGGDAGSCSHMRSLRDRAEDLSLAEAFYKLG